MQSTPHQSQLRTNLAFDAIHRKVNGDLVSVHRGHLAWMEDHLADQERLLVTTFVAKIMDGLYHQFDSSSFMSFAERQHGDVPTPIREQLDVIDKLALEFRGRVSLVVWEALACIAVQTVASEQPESIRGRKDLILPWQEVDVVLHAIAKPYDFFMHLQTRFCAAGYLLSHFGECGCCIRAVGPDVVRCFLRDSVKRDATEALMKHLHTEAVTILANELPHAASSGS